MDLEARIGELEALARDRLASEIAMDLVMRSIIATHPNARMLGNVIEGAMKQRVSQFQDVGFEKGYAPRIARSTIEQFQKQVSGWIQLCRSMPAGG